MTDTTTLTAEQAVTVTIPAPKLRELLTAVLVHAAEDDTMPAINAVQIEVRDGTLYLAATDRYTMGVARWRIPGSSESTVPDAACLLPLLDARTLHMLVEHETDAVGLVFHEDGRLTADALGAVRTWETETRLEFPGWRDVLGELLAGENVPLTDPYGVAPSLLARFGTGCRPFEPYEPPHDVLKLRAVRKEGTDYPYILATRRDWFLGALMPVRCKGDDRDPQWDSWRGACGASGVKP